MVTIKLIIKYGIITCISKDSNRFILSEFAWKCKMVYCQCWVKMIGSDEKIPAFYQNENVRRDKKMNKSHIEFTEIGREPTHKFQIETKQFS